MAFESLSQRLGGVFKRLRGKGKLTEADIKAAMREVRMALLEADVNYTVAKSFIAQVTERAMGQEVMESLTPAQQEALYKGAEAFCIVHAGITAASDAAALKDMADKGMKIHQPTADEQKMFREAAQPAALKIIAERIGQEWVDGAVKAAQEAEAKVAGKEQQLMDECVREAQEMVKIARGN